MKGFKDEVQQVQNGLPTGQGILSPSGSTGSRTKADATLYELPQK
jgi:hypothetical protein